MILKKLSTQLMTLLLCPVLVMNTCSAEDLVVGSKYDSYTKSTGVATKNYVLSDDDIGSSFTHAKSAYAVLLGNVTDEGKEGTEVRVVYADSQGWAFLSVAHDADGSSLPVSVVNRELQGGGFVKEEVSVSISRTYLEEHKATGLDMRVDGKNGQIVVKIPSTYVAAFLKGLESAEASARQKMASTTSMPGKRKLGVGFLPVDASNASQVGLASPRGVIVARVDPDSPASAAGIKVGDVIFAAGGTAVPGTLTGLPEVLAQFPAGVTVDFTIWRATAETHLTVRL